MKVVYIDFKGNLVRFYLGTREQFENSWGDDWNDRPFEHNAGEVDDKFVTKTVDVAFKMDVDVILPEDDYNFHGNTPFAMEDFKKARLARCIIAENDWYSFTQLEDKNKGFRIYFGEDWDKLYQQLVENNLLLA